MKFLFALTLFVSASLAYAADETGPKNLRCKLFAQYMNGNSGVNDEKDPVIQLKLQNNATQGDYYSGSQTVSLAKGLFAITISAVQPTPRSLLIKHDLVAISLVDIKRQIEVQVGANLEMQTDTSPDADEASLNYTTDTNKTGHPFATVECHLTAN